MFNVKANGGTTHDCGCRKSFPIRMLKRAEARAPERGIDAASPLALSKARTRSGNLHWQSL
ncbi:MAG TPA: hypothetical protein VFZ59_15965 [Verrucomicrobiae bacterium]|nr:hypothetical protein [Verrucomicrobiae bacterium]